MKILITGAAGSIGVPLTEALREVHEVFATDVDTLDVTKTRAFSASVWPNEPRLSLPVRPDVVYHLAADKHAPNGEENPGNTARINIDGTRNILDAAGEAKVILASTCKAANPETAYGASKLIAERMVLNAGGTVVRIYNVPETQGNVFRYWETIPEDQPIPYTDCWRYFVSLKRSVDLFVKALDLPPGRYAPYPGPRVHMEEMAARLYPHRERVEVPRRRGDRKEEPLHATCEKALFVSGETLHITSPHDG